VSNDHYFTANPQADLLPKSVSFEVAGETLTLTSSSGTFSSNRLDKGTAVLLQLADSFPAQGNVLDLGCGWGPIGISIAKLRPEVTVTGIDVNQRSVELANQNAKKLGLSNFKALLADELLEETKFDEIWSNPPIRIGKSALHEILEKHLGQLAPGGRAMLVIQKQLGAKSLFEWLEDKYPGWKIRKARNDRGYWVIEVASSPTRQ
jgi:16S rRNA G1207 methylase RsmC